MKEKDILAVLSSIIDPKSQKSLDQVASIEGVTVEDNAVKFRLVVAQASPEEKKNLRSLIEDAFRKEHMEVFVSITDRSMGELSKTPPQKTLQNFIREDILKKFKKIIAVYSTKGGVGKSTIAVELARRLADKNLKTALIDLDVYGPSVPRILGLRDKVSVFGEQFVPAEKDGISMMSVGILVPDIDAPLVWRAPIANGVMKQVFEDTLWEEYDILVLDMPPGTGDIPIAVGQSLPLDGLLAVSSPQGVALEDAVKGISMFEKFDVPILGMISNMGMVVCPKCGEQIELYPKNVEFDIFLMRHGIEKIASLPLDPQVAEYADKGMLEAIDPESVWSQEFTKIIDKVFDELKL